MITTSKASAFTGSQVRTSKEPDFLGPDELPMLPEYLVEQNPTDADKYHMQMKEWWESVHENLGRMREMVVSYQVADATESANSNLTTAKTLLSRQSQNLVNSLDSSLQAVIKQLDSALTEAINNHTGDTDNPHSVTAAQVSLGNVENTALSTWAGSANITTIGTISTGTVPAANTSGFNAVATSGNYSDLSGTPTLHAVATSGDYRDLSHKPQYSYDDTTKTLTITNT